MAHAMRKGERRGSKAPGRRPRPTNELALERLDAVAGRSRDDAALVAALLEAAAETAERHVAIGTLPTDEQALWASVGARFDPKAPRQNDHRVAEAFNDLLARSVLGDAAMASALRVDRTRISQRLAERSLYAFSVGDERAFPRWQLVGAKVIPGLKVVLGALDPALHPLAVDHWFTADNVDLEVEGEPASPVSWLATGGDPQVAAALAADR